MSIYDREHSHAPVLTGPFQNVPAMSSYDYMVLINPLKRGLGKSSAREILLPGYIMLY